MNKVADADGEPVAMDGCPWIWNWEQERYIMRRYDERRNGHYAGGGPRTPHWVEMGCSVLRGCEIRMQRSEVAQRAAMDAMRGRANG